jgi:hypothetical protein
MVNMSKLAWAFTMGLGEGGVCSTVETGYFGGFLIAPIEFSLILTPHSPKHVAVLEKESVAAKRIFCSSRTKD